MTSSYRRTKVPGHPKADDQGRIDTHIYMAEKALGRVLPQGVQVHHVNCEYLDNRAGNLVVCPDFAYHMLLHVRTRAFEGCGNADWRRCMYCREFDAVGRMVPHTTDTPSGTFTHSQCRRDYSRRRARAQATSPAAHPGAEGA